MADMLRQVLQDDASRNIGVFSFEPSTLMANVAPNVNKDCSRLPIRTVRRHAEHSPMVYT